MYCYKCDKDHNMKPIKDNKGNIAGEYCTNARMIIKSDTTKWNGEDIRDNLIAYTDTVIDQQQVGAVRPEKILGLCKMVAYSFVKNAKKKATGLTIILHYTMQKEL